MADFYRLMYRTAPGRYVCLLQSLEKLDCRKRRESILGDENNNISPPDLLIWECDGKYIPQEGRDLNGFGDGAYGY